VKRLVFAVSVMFGFGFMCGTGEPVEDQEPEKDVVVVPVPEGDDDEDGNWCCEYQDEDGEKRFALAKGAAACNNEFGDRDGRWVNDSKCTPCCCEAPNDPEDRSAGKNFELTTAASCSAVGECLAADAEQCSDEKGDDKAGRSRPSPRPSPSPGRVNERKTRPGAAPAPAPSGGGSRGKNGKRR
jgi:hypothetical protein